MKKDNTFMIYKTVEIIHRNIQYVHLIEHNVDKRGSIGKIIRFQCL